MKLVLFDCDGTLVDSQGIIHETMRRCFADAGEPEPDLAHTKSIIGLSLDHAISKMLSRPIDDDIRAMSQSYKDHFVILRGEGGFDSPLFAGIHELVAELARRDDVLLGMVTGKSRRGVRTVFKAHGFGEHFHAVRTADDCPSKPHPAMVLECCSELGIDAQDTLVIGDTSFDMEMARAAKARAIGVSWGYHPVEELKASGAHCIVDDAAAILNEV